MTAPLEYNRIQISAVGRQILWIIFALVLCVVVPMVFHHATGGFNNSRNPWWSTAIIVISGVGYASVIASKMRHLFEMVLWLFTYIFMGLAPFVQYRLDVTLSTTPYLDDSLYPVAGSLVLLCAAATLAGSFLAGQSRRPTRTMVDTVVVARRANLLSAVGVGIFLYYGSSVGFGSFLLSRTELSTLRQAAWPNPAVANMITGALHMVLLIAFLSQMAVREQRKAADQRSRILPAMLTGIVLLYAVNPVSSPRYIVGTVVLAVIATAGAYASMPRYRVMASVAMAGMLLIFPLADTFRHSTDAAVQTEGPVRALTSGDFDAFAQLVNTLTFVEVHGPTWGWQLVGVLLFWVPRSIWPSKPEDTGTVVAEFMGYNFTNLSSPLWSELLINFGWFGAVLGMGAFGYLFRRVDHSTDAYLKTNRIPPVAICAITFYLLILLRGSLLNAASYLLVILLATWFVSRKKDKTASPPKMYSQAINMDALKVD